jgi:hypothetical protein
MQMECWVNGAIPTDRNELAKYLGVLVADIERCFTQTQMSFLYEDGSELKSPELEAQRKEYLDRREKQRIGGIDGAKKKKEKQAARRLDNIEGTPKGQPKGSLNCINSNQVNSNLSISNQLIDRRLSTQEFKEWVTDYENAEDTKY